jgi:hypothetical protein
MQKKQIPLLHFSLQPSPNRRLARGPKGTWGAARWRRLLVRGGGKEEKGKCLGVPLLPVDLSCAVVCDALLSYK